MYEILKMSQSLLISLQIKTVSFMLSKIGYSKGADEEDRAQEASQDGEPLSRSQLLTEHLHPSKYKYWQQTGQHERCPCVHCYKVKKKKKSCKKPFKNRHNSTPFKEEKNFVCVYC